MKMKTALIGAALSILIVSVAGTIFSVPSDKLRVDPVTSTLNPGASEPHANAPEGFTMGATPRTGTENRVKQQPLIQNIRDTQPGQQLVPERNSGLVEAADISETLPVQSSPSFPVINDSHDPVADELLADANLLETCATVPRDDVEHFNAVDAARHEPIRVKQMQQDFSLCASVPVATRDEVTAAYQAAAEQGSVTAQFFTAARYPLGSELNMHWNQMAALNGHVEAQLTLARVLARSEALIDTHQAYGWLRAAERSGSRLANHYLAQMENDLPTSVWRELQDSSADN